MMVAVAVGSLVLLGAISVYIFSITSFATMANYKDLNQKSRYASDLITRDIRGGTVSSSTTATQLVLDEPDGTTTYSYDATSGTLIRLKNGESKILLSGIDSLSFALYQRPTPSLTYEQFATATAPANAKLVAFQWSCSRRLVGSRSESQSVEAALVDIRNQ
jgi:Tfp pilus assembly protein PilW